MNPENAMQPELQNKLTSILNWVEETAKQAGDFVVEQTPLYIQELLAWNFWYSLIWFILGVVYLGVGLFSIVKLIKNGKEILDSLEFSPNVLWVLPSVFGIGCGMCTIFGNLEWLQITVAPRVWLVEYVASKL